MDGERDGRWAALAVAIERRQPEIEELWLGRVRERFEVTHVAPTDLEDGISRYIRRLIESLRGGGALEATAAAAWEDVSSEHALNRVRLGFDVEQLMHELLLLRSAIVEVAAEELGAEASYVFQTVSTYIEPALASSVKRYTEARNHEARRTQAEHLGFIAHRLRSPLTAALLSLERLERLRPLAGDQADPLQRAIRNLHRIRELVEDALELETLRFDQMEARPTSVRLGELVDDIVAATRARAEAKSLTFRAEYDGDIELYADPSLVTQTLETLLENAVKYTPRGHVRFRVVEDDGSVTFHVRDTGPGLSAEERKYVFEPFRRGHTDVEGTGLGLAIARRAVEKLGGAIRVEPSDGEGSHFWFSLPRQPGA